ncbi:MAG: D-lactate dehydrogenase (cytochrome) Dld [Rhodobacteraceae bacterium HLUCCA08]|nr:MAG: D-lactate dehydrogenase (cytochrome) Dld [Rhodobacteraceae bacterium HLUCCA08]
MTIATAISELSTVLGDALSTSKADLEAHGRSESHFPLTPPDAVVRPRSTEEVAQVVRICAAHGCPVVGWGAGTSLEGHALALRGGVVVDFTDMAAVLEIRPEDRIARIQPGLTRERLNEELRATGLFFPVDPGADASLGGMASTRASGTTTVRYGSMRDNVAGLQVVLADGTVIRTGTQAAKSAAGYDLTALFVGAEGTLGLITELTLRLHGQPEAISAGICAFDAIEGAVDAAIEVIQTGLPVARIEFVDAATVAAVNAHSKADFPPRPHLLVEFHGAEDSVARDAARFARIAADHGATGIDHATRAEDRRRLWQMRHHAYWAILASRPGARAIVTDVCVPISALARAVAETRADIDASPIPGPILGHVGDGNFHAILLIDPENGDERAAAMRLSASMADRALRLGGTVSGEHGIGAGKLGYMAAEHGPAWAVMGRIRAALDPAGLMNPGKLVGET